MLRSALAVYPLTTELSSTQKQVHERLFKTVNLLILSKNVNKITLKSN